MAEFRKVMESVRRMCESYQHCAGCPLEDMHMKNGALYCDVADLHSSVKVTPGEYKNFENIVIDWAAKHSENNKYKCSDVSCPMRPLDGYCERNCQEKGK